MTRVCRRRRIGARAPDRGQRAAGPVPPAA